jgi:uncharacterized surface protein with fasciclin (FAS1) repeats
MLRRFPTLISAAALTFALGGLAACGEKAESPEASATAQTSTTTTTAEAPAADAMAADASATAGEQTVMVGGAAMYPSKNIIDNAVNSADHKTLVSAVTAAGLVDTLKGEGPFTVFAPTDAAFGKLPPGTVDTLVKPESKDALTKILTYHVVPGRLTADQLTDGQKLTTVQGGTLTVAKTATGVTLTDAKGGKSTVTQADVLQSNGVIHVVDTVAMPS